MYDTKTRELRWNATYFDYAASLPEDDVDYSKCLCKVGWVLVAYKEDRSRKLEFPSRHSWSPGSGLSMGL